MKLEKATLAGGCFWCIEAVFKRIDGVKSVVSGYSGGGMDNPSYEDVCSGETGHAEAVQVTFDPKKIGYEEILDIFWKAHDPTTVNRQGADVGSQYRSVIFYHDKKQKEIAEKSVKKTSKIFRTPIVTEIVPFENFYKAEDYHQQYYDRNTNAPYCRAVIGPKLKKLNLE